MLLEPAEREGRLEKKLDAALGFKGDAGVGGGGAGTGVLLSDSEEDDGAS